MCGVARPAVRRFYLFGRLNPGRGGPSSDPHGLDADGNGIACESNPCPCSYDQGGGGGGGNPPPPQVKRQKAVIVRVIDGDTAAVKLTPGPRETVRLLGINTPEPPNQCGAKKAKQKAKKLLPRGTEVLLVSDPTQSPQDRYRGSCVTS